MLTRRSAWVWQTAVFLLLPLLLAVAWRPLLPDRAALTIAAARGQLLPVAATALDGITFSPLWHGFLVLLDMLTVPPALLAAAISGLGWGVAALLLARRLGQRAQKWPSLLLPLLLIVSPLLPAAWGTAVPWQLAAVLFVSGAARSRQLRTQTVSLLLPLLWSDWPAWLLAGWALGQRWRQTGRMPVRDGVLTAVLFAGGGVLRYLVWGRLLSLPALDLSAAQAALTQLGADSDFYGLALLIALAALALALRRAPASLTGGLLLLGTVTLLADALLGTAMLLAAALAALAEAGAWLQVQLQPRLANVSPQAAGLVLTLLLALPLFWAQSSSLQLRYQARPLADAALLAQAGEWLAAAGDVETAVLAPADLATQIPQPLWPFSPPATFDAWGALMTALNEAPPGYVVSSDWLAWDRLVRTGWFQERYRPVQQFASQAAPQSPVTVWAYAETPFDRGATIPIQVRAENGLRLVGYRYEPRAIQPGDPVYVTLNWQTTAPIDRNVDTIVRLISPADQVGWAQRNLRTPRSLPPAWIAPEAVTFSERFVLTTTQEIPVGAYQLNVSQITGRDDAFTPLYQNEDANVLDRVLLGYVTVPWPEEIPAAATPVNAAFGDPVTGDPVTLHSYTLALHSYTLAGVPRPGETMTATLYWEAVQPPAADYTVFVHLFDAAGQFVAGFDSPPMNGRYPTRGWLPGSPVPDPHLLSLPPELPPGDYQLRAGLYLPESGERLTAVDAAGANAPNNAILLQTITVAP